MIISIRKCDRCGRQIESNENFWTITIREVENNLGMNTTKGICNNIEEAHMPKKEYCKNCMEEIRKVVKNVKN